MLSAAAAEMQWYYNSVATIDACHDQALHVRKPVSPTHFAWLVLAILGHHDVNESGFSSNTNEQLQAPCNLHRLIMITVEDARLERLQVHFVIHN